MEEAFGVKDLVVGFILIVGVGIATPLIHRAYKKWLYRSLLSKWWRRAEVAVAKGFAYRVSPWQIERENICSHNMAANVARRVNDYSYTLYQRKHVGESLK